MNHAVWRVSAPDLDVDALLSRFPELQGKARSWRQGAQGLGGMFHTSSGFTLSLADTGSFREALDAARDFFITRAPLLESLRELGASSLLDVGLVTHAPGDDRWVRNVRLTAEDLDWLARAGLDFELTLYPPDGDESQASPTGA
jgi:hypothetical protein